MLRATGVHSEHEIHETRHFFISANMTTLMSALMSTSVNALARNYVFVLSFHMNTNDTPYKSANVSGKPMRQNQYVNMEISFYHMLSCSYVKKNNNN